MKPDGRPEPAILAVRVDAGTGKVSWALHDTDDQDAAIVWGVPVPATGEIEGNIGRSMTNRKKAPCPPT